MRNVVGLVALAITILLGSTSRGKAADEVTDQLDRIKESLDNGDYKAAEAYATKLVNESFKKAGPDSLLTGVALSLLGSAYYRQGKLELAESVLRRSLVIIHKTAPESEGEYKTLVGFGLVCTASGKCDEAADALAKAATLADQKYGPVSSEYATVLKFLGDLYRKQRQYEMAEKVLKEGLAIVESQQEDSEGALIAPWLGSLADTYLNQEKFADARPLYERQLAIVERMMGPVHAETATMLNNVGNIYNKLEQFKQAEPLLERAVAIDEQLLGPDSPDLACELNNLADSYRGQGRFGEADSIYQRALAIHEKKLGSDHPDTARDLDDIASLYVLQGKLSEAMSLYRRALEVTEKALGPDHPRTKGIRVHLDSASKKQAGR